MDQFCSSLKASEVYEKDSMKLHSAIYKIYGTVNADSLQLDLCHGRLSDWSLQEMQR